jgi:hypothetical protein
MLILGHEEPVEKMRSGSPTALHMGGQTGRSGRGAEEVVALVRRLMEEPQHKGK